ncbi:MAG: tetratricopeptide repeat protein [Helicobacteraceae bacterium]|nr:tetratricopeptide repeat protein [Helicobacteraceae bacterium]
MSPEGGDDLYVARAYTHKYFGNNQQAIGDYSKALELNPSRGEIYYDRAMIRASLGDYDAASADLSDGIAITPYCDSRYFYARGIIRMKANDHKQAIKDFTSAIAGYAGLPQAYECRALSYEAIGDLGGAEKDRAAVAGDERGCVEPWRQRR